MSHGDREHWNERWRARGTTAPHRSSLLELVDPWLPPTGRALDVAGGGSGDAVQLARRGLTTTVVDVSDVALEAARVRAAEAGVELRTVRADLATDPLPTGPWQVITVSDYLQRDLFDPICAQLAGGGLLAVVVATTTNLERHRRPGARHL
ncbi:MAG: class I SAM-dependent methyltransferase, partial [Acidimicrobiales bacterium]